MKQKAIYIMANKPNGTLYIGVTSNLLQRVSITKMVALKGFTRRYNCKILVYYELFDAMMPAIIREKQIKDGSRAKKIALIESINPYWDDLFTQISK